MKSLRVTGKLILYLLCALLMLVALALAGARVAVFYIHDYKEQIAGIASSYLGSPVQIDHVDLVWDRFDAMASLTGVRIKSENGARTLLVLPRLELALNARDIVLQRKLTVRKVTLHGLSIHATYEGSGEISVVGYQAGRRSTGNTKPSGRNSNGPLAWIFNARSITILDSEILLTDRLRDREYKLDKLDIRAFNDGDKHRLRISSSLPNALGESSSAAFDFRGKANNVQDWEGQFYFNGVGLDLQELARIAGVQKIALDGSADLQLWGGWSGTRLSHVRAILDSDATIDYPAASIGESAVAVAAADSGGFGEPVKSALKIDTDWKRTEGGWQTGFNRLLLGFEDGEVNLSGLEVEVSKTGSGVSEVKLAGPDFYFPLPTELRRLLAPGLPHKAKKWLSIVQGGILKQWFAGLQWNDGKLSLHNLSADLVNVKTRAFGLVPGVDRLQASVFMREGVGRTVLQRQQLSLDTSNLTVKRIPPVTVEGTLRYAFGDGRFSVDAQNLHAETADVATSTALSLHRQADGTMPFTLTTTLLGGDLATADQYYLKPFMRKSVRRWLESSVLDGQLVNGEISLAGNARRFAPYYGKGQLAAHFEVRDATVKYLSDWPELTGVSASISLEGSALTANIHRGVARRSSFENAVVRIPNIQKPVVQVRGQTRGQVPDLLEFMQNGPLASSIGSYFGDASGVGEAEVVLDLDIPLVKGTGTRLRTDGSVTVNNIAVNARDYGLKADNVTGAFNFSQSGIEADDITLRYLGLPLKLSAVIEERENDQLNRVSVSGPVSLSSLLNSYEIVLPEIFNGVSTVDAELDVVTDANNETRVTLRANSDLRGTAINLPAPFDKLAESKQRTVISTDFSAEEQDWAIRVPGQLDSRIRVDANGEVQSMAFALGGSTNTVMPWSGIAINGRLESMAALQWVQFALDVSALTEETEDPEPFPLFANLIADKAVIGGRDIGKLRYTAFRDGTHQVHRVENRWVSGELQERKTDDPNEPLLVQLGLLDYELLAAIGDEPVDDDMTDNPLDPREIPPLDISVKNLKWDTWRFSRVSLRTRPSDYGMEIQGLSVRQDSMRVSGNGRWSVRGSGAEQRHNTAIDVTASLLDVGRAVEEVGGGKTFAAGNGEVGLSLSWPSEAYSPELGEMTGQLFFFLREGRFLSVDPGAGRILGLFALQALPRRLTLDFRDIYKTGLEYSSVNGNFVISDGVARSESLQLVGPVAEILVRGATDFVNQQYDQEIDVLPRVSAALPILGILSGGAAAGVTAIVADGILKGVGLNLDEFGRRHYMLSGTWEDPKLVPIEVKF